MNRKNVGRNRATMWQDGKAVMENDYAWYGHDKDIENDICEDETGLVFEGYTGYMWKLIPCLLRKLESGEIPKIDGFKIRVRSNLDGSVKIDDSGNMSSMDLRRGETGPFCIVEMQVDLSIAEVHNSVSDCYCTSKEGKFDSKENRNGHYRLHEVTQAPAEAAAACKKLEMGNLTKEQKEKYRKERDAIDARNAANGK